MEKLEYSLTERLEMEAETVDELKEQLDKCLAIAEGLRMELEENRREIFNIKQDYEQQLNELRKSAHTLEIELQQCLKEREDISHTYKNMNAHVSASTYNIRRRLERALEEKAELQKYKELVRTTLRVKESKTYMPAVRSLIRGMVVRSCPLKNVGMIFDGFYQIFIKKLVPEAKRIEKIQLDSRTARRIVEEGRIAAGLQMIIEIIRSQGQLVPLQV